MSLRDIIIQEIMNVHDDDENFGKEELEGLEDIELFHLYNGKIKREAWQRGFINGHEMGSQESYEIEGGPIQLEIDLSKLEQTNIEEQNENNQI